MQTLAIDIETYSSADLAKTGVYKYVEAPDFAILLFAYSFDDEPAQLVDLASYKNTIPNRVLNALTDPAILKTAYNAPFERVCIAKFFDVVLPPEQWSCTMVLGAMAGLPMGLDAVTKALKLDVQKDTVGKALIRYFSVPCRPTKTNGERTRNLPKHDPYKWQQFCDYCVKDVIVEKSVRAKLVNFAITDTEKRVWQLDQLINDRGVLLDSGFVHNAILIDNECREKLNNEAIELTGLGNPNSAAQLKQWLSEETGDEVDSLTKDAIPQLLEKVDCDIVKRVLKIRQEMAKTSVKKYIAMNNAICADNRVRGLLQYYGASRTGRWAGRLIQVQNLPKNELKDLDLARQLVYERDSDMLQLLFGNVPDTLSQLIRTSFIAPEKHRFIVADFSAIEARVIAWLAGEKWRLDVFKTHGKIYEASASQMFKVPIESVTKGSVLRQKGKMAELACIAKGQLVLTNKGAIPIEKISTKHLLWDGENYVKHEGVVYKGLKKVISYGNLTATTDHLVWIEGYAQPIEFGQASETGACLLRSGNSRGPLRVGKDYKSGKKMADRMERSQSFCSMHRVPSTKMDVLLQPVSKQVQRLSKMLATSPVSQMGRSSPDGSETTLQQSKRQKLSQLRGKRNRVQISFRSRSGFMDSKQFGNPGKNFRTGQNRQQRSLRTWESSLRTQRTKPSKPAIVETYDVVNAGSNSRFTVSNVLVHNCGYQGGPEAIKRIEVSNKTPVKDRIPEEELPAIIKEWRNANKAIVQLWYKVQDCAILAVSAGAPARIGHGVEFKKSGNNLHIILPSGRTLVYVNAKTHEGQYGDYIVYEGMDQTTKQWKAVDTYGGKLVENIVQAIARDCLADAMLRLQDNRIRICMHVHDEIVAEVHEEDVNDALNIINEIMSTEIPWAKGLPLKADSYDTVYYKKD